jgi:hypothetical protein
VGGGAKTFIGVLVVQPFGSHLKLSIINEARALATLLYLPNSTIKERGSISALEV